MKTILKFSIFILFITLFFTISSAAEAASLYLSPSSGTYTIGKTFSVSVYVSSTEQAMNAASGVVDFPEDKLEVVSLSKSGSIISLWVQEPSFSNGAGTFSFEGIVLNPGFTGSGGKIIVANFKVKAIGTAVVSFSSGSVLANDGKGTNILTGLGSGNYTLKATSVGPSPAATPTPQPSPAPIPTAVPSAPQISSETHPSQTQWYNKNNIKFSWSLTSDITDVSILLDQKADSNPGNVSDGLFNSKTYENVSEGIWYFHLKLKNKKGWGAISHYKIMNDLTPPSPFEITVVDGQETTNPQPTLLFTTEDKLSGLSHYEIKIGDGDFFKVEPPEKVAHNPFKMPYQDPGTHSILVRAYDKAGNSQGAASEVIIKPSPVSQPAPAGIKIGAKLISYGIIIIVLLIVLALIIIGVLLVWYKIKLLRAKLRKEVKEMEESLHGGFDILRDDIRDELEELEKLKALRDLTPKERTLRQKLIKDLNIVEKYIKKEIKDIEKRLE